MTVVIQEKETGNIEEFQADKVRQDNEEIILVHDGSEVHFPMNDFKILESLS